MLSPVLARYARYQILVPQKDERILMKLSEGLGDDGHSLSSDGFVNFGSSSIIIYC